MRHLEILGESDNLEMNGTLITNIKLGGSQLEITLKGSYDNEHDKQYNLDILRLGSNNTDKSSTENRYSKIPTMQYKYSAAAKYGLINDLGSKPIQIDLQYKYSQEYRGRERQLYHLNLYEGYRYETGRLPSTTDSLQAAIDIRNSYYSSSLQRVHTLSLDFRWKYLQLVLPISWSDDCISDFRNQGSKNVSRHKPHTDIILFYYKKGFTARYNYRIELPPLNYLLDVRDDSDPLYISLGNPNLGSMKQQSVNLSYRKNQTMRQRQISVSCFWNMMHDAVCMGRHYNTETGITTAKPQNINGNWLTRLRFSFGQSVDRKHRLRLSTTAESSLRHSVDYATLVTSGNLLLSDDKNSVNNLTIGETIKGDYRHKDLHLGLTAHVEWNQVLSLSGAFSNINAWHINYGLTLAKKILKRIDLESDLTMWSRRGYRDQSMNDNQLIWNASVVCSIDKLSRWNIRLKASDILRQVNAVRQTTNSQGRIETWYRTIPSYVLFSFIYQFKKAPPKKIE